MKAFIITLAFLFICTMAAAAPYIHNNISADGALGAAPDPIQTVLIADNYSHTVTVTNQIWYDLAYNGSGTCIIRLMNTTTKASWPAEQVQSGGPVHSYMIHGNTKFINYSGCNGGTAPANSILHLM